LEPTLDVMMSMALVKSTVRQGLTLVHFSAHLK